MRRSIVVDDIAYSFVVETNEYITSISIYNDEGVYIGAFEDESRDIFLQRPANTISMLKKENPYYSARKLEYAGERGVQAANTLLQSLSCEQLINSVKAYLV